MARRVKDVIEISDYTSLDALIERLQTIHASLSEWASPEVSVRGDDFFGQRLSIAYLRELTQEEAAIEEKYSTAGVGIAPPISAAAQCQTTWPRTYLRAPEAGVTKLEILMSAMGGKRRIARGHPVALEAWNHPQATLRPVRNEYW